MKIIANIVGVCAVILFVLSYQFKTKRKIILCNVASRVLYVTQYLLLFAFEGAVLDVVGILASVLAQNSEKGFVKKHIKIFIIVTNIVIIGSGILLYKNLFSLLPMMGVLLHTGAFWLKNEKYIRIVSFLGSPFWFVYNLFTCAYGSALGDVLTMCSIVSAIYRYYIKKRNV